MKLKFEITNLDNLVVGQEINSDSSPEKDGVNFFIKLDDYALQFINAFNKQNASHIKFLKIYDENDVLIKEFKKDEV